MSCLLKLVRLTDFVADIDELDLLSGGFALADEGYTPVSAPWGAAYVDETITLKITGSTKDDLASKIHLLEEKIKQAQWWMEDSTVERYQVWLRSQLDNESLPRQAMLADIRPPDKVRIYNPVEINSNYIGEYTLGITRTANWEDSYPYPTTTQLSNVNVIGGTATLAETIRGDVPARLLRLGAFKNDASAGLSNFWYGWKTSRFGTAANFVPVWSLALGGGRDADTNIVGDGNAYNGNKITTTFSVSPSPLLQRTVITVADVTANYNDQRGTYAVLLRAKVSDTSLMRARISFSLSSGTTLLNPIYRDLTNISGMAWQLYEMGTISIPPSRIYASMHSLKFFGVAIEAQRITGSGSLDMDCLILIPIDDGGMSVQSSVSVESGQTASVFQAADGSVFGYADNGTGDSMGPVVTKPLSKWGLPANDESPILVFAASDTTLGSTRAKTEHIIYTYIPRWRTLRGNET